MIYVFVALMMIGAASGANALSRYFDEPAANALTLGLGLFTGYLIACGERQFDKRRSS